MGRWSGGGEGLRGSQARARGSDWDLNTNIAAEGQLMVERRHRHQCCLEQGRAQEDEGGWHRVWRTGAELREVENIRLVLGGSSISTNT